MPEPRTPTPQTANRKPLSLNPLAPQREQIAQLVGRQLGDPVLAGADDLLAEAELALDHLIDALLKRAQRHELVHLHMARLADTEGAVRRLILDGGVPPAIVVEHMIRRRQVEPDAAGLQRKNEHIPLLVDGWSSGLGSARSSHRAYFRCSAVQEQHFLAKLLLQHMLEQVSGLHKLRENQAFVAFLAQLLHHLQQALQLVRASAPWRVVPSLSSKAG